MTKNLLIIFFSSISIILSTAVKVAALNFSYSHTLDVTDEGQWQIESNLEINNARNIYILDGINNSIEIFSQFEELKSFRSNFLSDNDKVFSDSQDNVYLIDGINNRLTINPLATNNEVADSGGNVYFINGINNHLGKISFNQTSSGFVEAFTWSKTLVPQQSPSYYWSSQMETEGANNIYAVDGINNRLNALSFSSHETGNFYVVDGFNNSFDVFNSYQGSNKTGQLNWNKGLVSDNEGNLSWSNEVTANDSKSLFQIDGINQTVERAWLNQEQNYLYSLNGINNSLQVLPPHPNLFSLFDIFTQNEVPTWDAGNEFEIEPSFLSFLSDLAGDEQPVFSPESFSLAELENMFLGTFGEQSLISPQFFELLTFLSNNDELVFADLLNNESLLPFNFNDILITEDTENSPSQNVVSVPEPSLKLGLALLAAIKLITWLKKSHKREKLVEK